MPVQDDVRENEAVQRFNLIQDEGRRRGDIDAYLEIDGLRLPFELKSTTSDSVSTVRDFGPDHVNKWRNGLHWIFAFYTKDGTKLKYCCYASPLDMAPWIAEKEKYVASDFYLASTVPAFVNKEMVEDILGSKEVYSLSDAARIMKKQWNQKQYKENSDIDFDPNFAEVTVNGRPKVNPGGYSLQRMTRILQLRCDYVIRRGSTLNNPHIEKAYFDSFEKITTNHAETLRRLVRVYLDKVAATEDATA